MTGGDTLDHGRPANGEAQASETDELRVGACLAVDLW
jgi:hypothetical protein